MSQSTNLVQVFPEVDVLSLIKSATADAEHSHPPVCTLVRPTLRQPQNSWIAPAPYWQAQNLEAVMLKLRPDSETPSTERLDMFWDPTNDFPQIDAKSEQIELIECFVTGEGLLTEHELAYTLNCQVFNSKNGVDPTWKAAALYSGQNGNVVHVMRYDNGTDIEFFDAASGFTTPSLGKLSFEKLGNDLKVIVDETESASLYIHELVLKYWTGEEFTFCRNQIPFTADPETHNRFTAIIPNGLEVRLFLAVVREDPRPEELPPLVLDLD